MTPLIGPTGQAYYAPKKRKKKPGELGIGAALGVAIQVPEPAPSPRATPVPQPAPAPKVEVIPTGDTGDTVANMSLAYHSVFGTLPSPEKAMMLTINTPAWMQSVDDFRDILFPGKNIVAAATEFRGAEDIFYGAGRTIDKDAFDRFFSKPGAAEMADASAIERALDFINRPSLERAWERNTLISDLSFSLTGSANPQWTPELDAKLRRLVFNYALPFNLFGDEKQRKQAGSLVEWATQGAFKDDVSIAPIYEVMQYEDDEKLVKLAYDGFMAFETRINKKSDSFARYSYVETFGYDRMPPDDAAIAKDEIEWFPEFLGDVVGKVWDGVKWVAKEAVKDPAVLAGHQAKRLWIAADTELGKLFDDSNIGYGAFKKDLHASVEKLSEGTGSNKVANLISVAASDFASAVKLTFTDIGKAYSIYDEYTNRIMVAAYFALTDGAPNSLPRAWKDAEHRRIVYEILDDVGYDLKAHPSGAAWIDFFAMLGRDIKVGKALAAATKVTAGIGYEAARTVYGVPELGAETRAVTTIPEALPEPVLAKPKMKASTTGKYKTRVTEVNIGGQAVEVDAGMARNIQKLNNAGIETKGSHSSLPGDHPKGHPARETPGYIEFAKDDPTILAAAEKHGLTAEISAEKTLVVKNPAVDAAGKPIVAQTLQKKWNAFTDEVTTPLPITTQVPTGTNRLLDWAIVNNAESIAYGTNPGDEFAIRELWGITHFENEIKNAEVQSIVKKMAASKDPAEVSHYLSELAIVHEEIIDPGASALIKNLKLRTYRDGLNAEWSPLKQAFFSHIHMSNTSPMLDADKALYTVGRSVKMGKEDWTAAEAVELKQFASRMYLAANDIERKAIFEEFDAKVIKAMTDKKTSWYVRRRGLPTRQTGTTLDYYNHWLTATYRSAVKYLEGRGRAYYGVAKDGEVVEKSMVVPVNTSRKLALAKREAKMEIDKLLVDSGVTPEQIRAAGDFYAEADKALADFIWAKDVLKPGVKSSAIDVGKATRIMNNYCSPRPFEYTQLMKTYQHQFNPHLLARFMASPANRTWESVQQFSITGARFPISIQEVTNTYKTIVMANMGFPIRVTLGDEAVRLFTEGIAGGVFKSLIKTGKTPAKRLRLAGVLDDATRNRLHEGLARAYHGDLEHDWTSVLPGEHGHPMGYSRMLKRLQGDPFLRIWAEEVNARGAQGAAVRAHDRAENLLKTTTGKEPSYGVQLRNHMVETQRATGTSWGTLSDQTKEWLADWRDRLAAIEDNTRLRKAYMTGKLSADDYNQVFRANPDLLGPASVTKAPFIVQQMGPLSALSFPWKILGNAVTFKMLDKMSNMMREASFAYKYEAEEAAMKAARAGKLSEEQLAEVSNIAKDRGVRYADRVMYTHDITVFEDAMRSVFLFMPAYRQFVSYWLRLFAKQPVAMVGVKENYPLDPTKPLQIPGLGDLSVYFPIGPFWASQDDPGWLGFLKSNLPNLAPVPGMGVGVLGEATGIDMRWIKSLPGFAYINQDKGWIPKLDDLMYGLGVEGVPVLQGDSYQREKMRFNIAIGQIRAGFKPDLSKSIDQMRDVPWYWWIADLVSKNPEGVIAGAIKTFSPISGTYMPKKTKEMLDAYYEFNQARGDAGKEASVYASYPDFAKVSLFESLRDTNSEQADELLRDNPWIVLYTTARHNPVDGVNTLRTSQERYDQLYSYGYKNWASYRDDVDAMLKKIRNAGTIGDAQKQYDSDLKTARKLAEVVALRAAGGKKNELFNDLMKTWENRPYVSIDPETGVPHYTNRYPFDRGEIAKYIPDMMYRAYMENKANEGITTSRAPGEKTIGLFATLLSMQDEETRMKLMAATPFSENLDEFHKNLTDDINKNIMNAALSGYWKINSPELQSIGIKAANRKTDAAIDAVQRAYQDYLDFQKTNGNKWNNEAKMAKARFQNRKDAIFAARAPFLAGGTAERVKRSGLLTTPHIVWAPQSLQEEKMLRLNINKFNRVLDKAWGVVISEKTPDTAKGLKKAVDTYLSTQPEYVRANAHEVIRARAWSWILEGATVYRGQLKEGYNKWNKSKGFSLYSNLGEEKVKYLNLALDYVRKVEPSMDEDIKRYFGTRNVAAALLDWIR